MRATFHVLLLMLLLPWPAAAQDGKTGDKVRGLYAKGKVYAGIRKCTRGLSGKSPEQALLVLRAEGYNRIGEHGKAAADARAARPHVSGGRAQAAALQLGIAQAGLGWPDSARVWLDRSLGAEDDAEAHYRIGLLDRAAGRCGEAIAAFDRALALHPDRTNALRERGGCRAVLGDTAGARADIDRALAIAPRDPANWNSHGFHVHAAHGRYAEAIADYGRAIKLDPNYSYAFNNRGWAWYKLGEKDKALRNIAMAGRKKKDNPHVYRNLGVIALESGEKERACGHFRAALGLHITALAGPEVEDLFRIHCGVPPAAPDPAKPPAPRTNAPVRGNAP